MIECDIAVIGASAAGLAAAIFAAETARGRTRIVLIEGARKPGAKIMVSGGGRCNVTNEKVTPDDYYGGSSVIVRNVLRAFNERHTLEWMRGLGVDLKLESTGKYFPVTDSSRTVLEALLRKVEEVGIRLLTSTRVGDIRQADTGWELVQTDGNVFLKASKVIVATGGLALPKSGSDGTGLNWMQRLGHTIIPTTPALAPLLLKASPAPGGRFAEFSGITMDLRMALLEPGGRELFSFTGSLVFTHFGLSGPTAMNLSRHIARWRFEHPGTPPRVALGHPAFPSIGHAVEWLTEQQNENPKRLVATALADLYPERIARAISEPFSRFGNLTRQQRRDLAEAIAAMAVEVTGDRGYSFAEATAGGVDLREIDVRTMESRILRNLFLCGEVLDVDGRIGGFNFQWAWSTGYLAGRAAAGSV